jgi:hypothetical protein
MDQHLKGELKSAVKFVGWKLVELALYVLAFPFLFVGLWLERASDWCGERARPYEPPRL